MPNRIWTLLISTMLAAFVFVGPSPAEAADRNQVCNHSGTTNALYVSGDPIEMGELLAQEDNTLETANCRLAGFRLIRFDANTKAEVASLHQFWLHAEGRHVQPMVWCKASGKKAYMLDLAYFWRRDIHSMTSHEKTNYVDWAKGYAQAHNCKA